MRILYYLIAILFITFSCENGVSSIGDEFIDNESSIELQRIVLDNTGTIKVDSFVTNITSSAEGTTPIIAGRVNDPYSGEIISIPTFQISPTRVLQVNDNYALDSVTFQYHIDSAYVWADTNNTSIQAFDLVRLASIPEFDFSEDNPYLHYNNSEINLSSEILSTTRFIPERHVMDAARFPMSIAPGSLADRIWNEMKTNREGWLDVEKDPLAFINFFKGVAIVPHSTNQGMFGFALDSMKLVFHYRVPGGTEDQETSISIDFYNALPYAFNQIKVAAPTANLAPLVTQRDIVPLKPNMENYAIAQGLAGYMIKTEFPANFQSEQYRAIIKAELELSPLNVNSEVIPNPPLLAPLATNQFNELKGFIYNSEMSSDPIMGVRVENPIVPQDVRYIFNITDYYQNFTQMVNPRPQDSQILISIPGFSTSFDRLVLEKPPVLRVYYANYNHIN